MADRLRLVLPKLISPTQLAFVPRRAIQDNYIVAAEIFHGMNHKQGRGEWMAIKADMEKAYDRVEWKFVLKIFEKFGFSSTWINWIQQCISTYLLFHSSQWEPLLEFSAFAGSSTR